MNIQLANVLSDISGKSGQAIIKSILQGERDGGELAALCDRRVQASQEEVAGSLDGNWQDDLLFVLQQEQDGYEFCQTQMVNQSVANSINDRRQVVGFALNTHCSIY